MRPRLVRLGAALAVALAGGACGGDGKGGEAGAGGSGGGLPSGTVTVLAASSLTEAFTEIAERFERAHPDVQVELSFAASSQLVVQIQQGAPGDVFASADTATMDQVVASDDVASPDVFARNRLEIAVEPGNPADIQGLADLAGDDLIVVLCAEQVPCGALADVALANAGVEIDVASREENVKAALSKVELGEADAAIVYETDVAASDSVEGVTIPRADNVVTRYPIARLAEAGNRSGADAFIAFVRARPGRQILAQFGFLGP